MIQVEGSTNTIEGSQMVVIKTKAPGKNEILIIMAICKNIINMLVLLIRVRRYV